MAYEVKLGEASLWSRDGNNNGPVLSGSVIAHRDIREGEQLDVAFWINHPKDGKQLSEKAPKYTGSIKDKWVNPNAGGFETRPPNEDTSQGGHQSRADHAASQDDEFDDTIPF